MSIEIQNQIATIANQYGVPPSIALGVAKTESNFNQAAMGAKGEIGVFQLMPATAAGLGVNPSDLLSNITGGVGLLKQMFDRFGDWGKALAAYNAGPTAVVKGKIPASTQQYVTKVMDNAVGFDSFGYPEAPAAPESQVTVADSGLFGSNPLSGYSGDGTDGTGESGYSSIGMLIGVVGLGILGAWFIS